MKHHRFVDPGIFGDGPDGQLDGCRHGGLSHPATNGGNSHNRAARQIGDLRQSRNESMYIPAGFLPISGKESRAPAPVAGYQATKLPLGNIRLVRVFNYQRDPRVRIIPVAEQLLPFYRNCKVFVIADCLRRIRVGKRTGDRETSCHVPRFMAQIPEQITALTIRLFRHAVRGVDCT